MVKVIALKSFLYDTEVKTIDSPPFPVKHYDLVELKELGLVKEFTEAPSEFSSLKETKTKGK